MPSSVLINAREQLIFAQKGFSDETHSILAAFIEEELKATTPKTLPTKKAAPAKATAKKPLAKAVTSRTNSSPKPAAKTNTKAPAKPSAAQRALAQSRAKVPASSKSNGIFVLDDDGIKPAR